MRLDARQAGQLLAFETLRTGLERLAGDMVLELARLDPEAFRERVMRRAGALASVCPKCRTTRALFDAYGSGGCVAPMTHDCWQCRLAHRAVVGGVH